MTSTIDAIRGEYLRYKGLAEAAIAQLTDADLVGVESDSAAQPDPKVGPTSGASLDNSIATICWHISGNLESRFTDFLTSDGEKSWRDREEEFALRIVTKAELLAKWQRGWDALLPALANLRDEDLQRTVTIRRQPLQVNEALERSLAHLSYHVGQIVYIAKSRCGPGWVSLSIPRGESARYNQSGTSDRPAGQAELIKSRLEQEEK